MCLPQWTRCALAAVALMLGTSAPAQPGQSLPRFQWWHSDRFQRELSLSAEQVARIDALFQATLPELRQRKEELDRLETELSRLIDADTDEATVARNVDKAEAARGNLTKTRTLMLVRMRQVLTPDQRSRFNTLHATLHAERARSRAERHTRGDGRPRHDK